MTEPLKTESKLETVAWRDPRYGSFHSDLTHQIHMDDDELRPQAERLTQALCDQSTAESLLAQRDAQIAGLQAQVEAMRANDARYRALRERLITGMPVAVDWLDALAPDIGFTPEGLDSAIDSAMQQQKGGEDD